MIFISNSSILDTTVDEEEDEDISLDLVLKSKNVKTNAGLLEK